MKWIKAFFQTEAAAGIFLSLAVILALVLKNSPLAEVYTAFLNIQLTLPLGVLTVSKPLTLWINDALMAFFFFVVGMEIKREVMAGELSTLDQRRLPVLAALGGLIVPALMYLLFNAEDPVARQGWAIPAATDIAFAVGVMVVLGKRVPTALKVCLLAIAIIDDLAAILIIAFFYTADLSWQALVIAGMFLSLLIFLSKQNVFSIPLYMILGACMWLAVLKSGVHATLAGVLLGLCIPLKYKGQGVLEKLEHDCHPYVAYMILPLFAFANAGIPLGGLGFETLLHPVTLGILVGLFVGKQLGVLAFTWIGTQLGLCALPRGVRWTSFYGLALITGIGFTMSLFIGNLAFPGDLFQTPVRLGVLVGSLLSGVCGYMVLRLCSKT